MGQAQSQDTLKGPAAVGFGWRAFQLGGFLTAVSWFLSYFLFLNGYEALQVVFTTDYLLWILGGIGYFLSPLISLVLIAMAVWPRAVGFLNGDTWRALGARALLFLIPFLWLGSVFVGDTAMIDRMLTAPLGHSTALPVFGGATIHVVFQHWFQGFAAILLAMTPDRFSTLTESDRPAGGGAVIRDVTAQMELEDRLAALHEATRAMMNADSPNEVARIASEASSDVVGIQYSRVHLQDGDSDELVPAAWTDETEQALDGDPPPVDPDSGLVWERFQKGEAGYFHNYDAMEWADDQETPLQSSLLLPLGDHGIMLVQSRDPAAFTDANIELAKILSASTQAALARTRRERELELLEALLDQSSDCVFVIEPDTGRFLDVNEPAVRKLDYSRDDLLSMTLHAVVTDLAEWADVGALLQEIRDQGLVTLEGAYQRNDGSTFPVQLTVNHIELDQEYVLAIARDVSEQRERRQELAVKSAELELLGFLQQFTNALIQQVLAPTSRADIELQACELLTESRFYTDAWFVDPSQTGRSVHSGDGAAGGTADGGKLRRLDEMPAEDPLTDAVHDAIETNQPQVLTYSPGPGGAATAVSDAETAPQNPSESESRAKSESEPEPAGQTAITLPLTYGESNYGALVLLTDRPSPFGTRETAALETLILGLALAIHVRMQESMPRDDAIELEFHAFESTALVSRLAATLGGPVQLEGLVPRTDGTASHYYITEADTAGDDLCDLVQAMDGVEECRVIDHDECLFEVTGRSTDILDAVVNTGGVIRTAEAGPDNARLVIDLPPDTSTEEVKTVVQNADSTWEVTEQRRVEWPLRRVQDACRILEESLTDKQREALLTAYFAGYYDFPRTANAQEIADTLAITDSTLFQHLQAAQRKLIDAWVDPID